jgi:hypothetical protein
MKTKRIALAVALSLALACAAAAMPASFVDTEEGVSGWLSMGLRYFLPVGGTKSNLAFEFAGAGPQRIGMGIELGGNGTGKGLMLALSGLYFLDPIAAEDFTLPFKLRLGFLSSPELADWFVSLSAGALYFAPRYRYDVPDNPKETCLTAGVDGELYYFHGRLYPAASASGNFALRMGPRQDSAYYYYY